MFHFQKLVVENNVTSEFSQSVDLINLHSVLKLHLKYYGDFFLHLHAMTMYISP